MPYEEKAWDPYAPTLEMQITLTLFFRELCRMLEIDPVRVLVVDFSRDILDPILFRETTLTMSPAAEYFASIRHKNALFTPEQIKAMIHDIIVIKALYPTTGEGALGGGKNEIMRDLFLNAWKTKWCGIKQAKKKEANNHKINRQSHE